MTNQISKMTKLVFALSLIFFVSVGVALGDGYPVYDLILGLENSYGNHPELTPGPHAYSLSSEKLIPVFLNESNVWEPGRDNGGARAI